LAPGRVIVERRKINLFPVFPLDIKIARVVVSEISKCLSRQKSWSRVAAGRSVGGCTSHRKEGVYMQISVRHGVPPCSAPLPATSNLHMQSSYSALFLRQNNDLSQRPSDRPGRWTTLSQVRCSGMASSPRPRPPALGHKTLLAPQSFLPLGNIPRRRQKHQKG